MFFTIFLSAAIFPSATRRLTARTAFPFLPARQLRVLENNFQDFSAQQIKIQTVTRIINKNDISRCFLPEKQKDRLKKTKTVKTA